MLNDTQRMLLEKILTAINGITTLTISGITGVYAGNGPPVGAPASGATAALYYDTSTGTIYEWDNATLSWV